MYDDEEDGEPEYSREDFEADRADRLIKEMKIDGTYKAWRDSHLPYNEWQRRNLEDEHERAKAAHARRLAEARRLDGPDGL